MRFLAILTMLTLAASVALAADTTKVEVKDTTEASAKEAPAKAVVAEKETPKGTAKVDTITTKSGLAYIDHKVGTGAEAKVGMTVTVHYTGWLFENGKRTTKFDSSVDRGQTIGFKLANGSVISGWVEGVAGMKIGGKRELIIPPALGYGSRGYPGAIPPNATLLFEVELFGVTE